MAKFHYDVTGAEPIVRDVPVYDSATLVEGEFIMLDPAAATDCQFITGYTTANTEMVDGLGVMNETLTTSSVADHGDAITTAATTTTAAISSVACGSAAGSRYGKAIINPFAIYLTEYSEGTSDDVALTQAWSTTTLTLTNLEDNIDGGWIYGSTASVTSGFAGQLRYMVASAAGSCTLESAPTVAGSHTAVDQIIKILPVAHRLTALDATSTKLKSLAAAGSGVSLCVVENYIGGKVLPLEPLRYQCHKGTDWGDDNVKLYSDIQLMNHLWNPLS